MTKSNDWLIKPLDITAELNAIKGRLEALEQKIYTLKATREDREADQKAINLKGKLNGI